MEYTKDMIEKSVKSKGYLWFDGEKDYDVNIVGIRNSSTGKKVTNLFDDWITISYKAGGIWESYCWPGTTDPGTKAVKNFSNPSGVGRLVPGQYRGVWSIDLHRGEYQALCQRNGKVKVWRDRNRDMLFEESTIEEGMFGINIHRSNPKTESEYVENWSEGCQVFKRVRDFNKFMSICKKASETYSNKFTYTLMTSDDFNDI